MSSVIRSLNSWQTGLQSRKTFWSSPLIIKATIRASGSPGIAMATAKTASSSTVLSATVKHFSLLHRPSQTFYTTRITVPGNRGNKKQVVAMCSKASDPLQVCVKESLTVPSRLGDCPFSQRVLLTLEEKHLPYDLKVVDFRDKPEWFLNISPEGKVPVVKLDEKWIADSDVITQALEEKFPDPPLATPPEKAAVGSKIFSTFIGFLKSKDSSDGTEQALINELTSFNNYLEVNGPYINGKVISAADLSLGPKLYHLEIALGHYKKWAVPDSLTSLKLYMQSIFSMDSFVKTRALQEDVIEGWRPKVEG